MKRNKRQKTALKTITLKNNQTGKPANGYLSRIIRKNVSMTRSDVATWKTAQQQANNADAPKRVRLMKLYDDIMLDALLTSQVENRRLQTVSAPFTLKDSKGNENEEATLLLQTSGAYSTIVNAILGSLFYGCSVVELGYNVEQLNAWLLPRKNIAPDFGRFYPDADADNYIDYRNAREYGTWLLEFNTGELGLLNKAVPHILFKKYAQSCWSELCEIYGIPPRYMKTNTQDAGMLDRAESMMRDMGAAAWFIIDETEEFNFAKGADTNGDVYNNLIRLCNNEVSLLVSGAIIGQDTQHGTRGKEQVSQDIQNRLVIADRKLVEQYMNSLVLPALYKIGFLPDGLFFEFASEEDPEKLWKMTTEILPYKDVDNEWINNKFGIPVSNKQLSMNGAELSVKNENGFFA